MPLGPTPRLQHKKEPFLRALQRVGKVVPAARAVKISCDAVYDWIHSDPSFRRQFNLAKKNRFDSKTALMSDALDIFLRIAAPIVGPELYRQVVAAAHLGLTNHKFKEVSRSTARASSRNNTRFPSFDIYPEVATPANGGSRANLGKNGTLT